VLGAIAERQWKRQGLKGPERTDMSDKVVNVLDFGADPSGREDSTLAFRKAIRDAVECEALDADVNVPQGVYKLSGFLFGYADAEAELVPSSPNIDEESAEAEEE